MLAYFLKINVAIALFYAFYRLFFYKDTFFTWRRVALLCFFAVSAVYPLLNIQTWITEQEPMVAMADLYADIVLPEFTLTPEKTTFDWKSILLQTAGFVYWGGVALLAGRFLVQLAGIIRLAFRSRKTKIGNTNVHLLKQVYVGVSNLSLDIHSSGFTYRRGIKRNINPRTGTCQPMAFYRCTYQRNCMRTLLVQSLCLAHETGNPHQPGILSGQSRIGNRA